ncbi:MAG: hypothetical protein ACRYE8_04720 [Janthinobacterium lividum]
MLLHSPKKALGIIPWLVCGMTPRMFFDPRGQCHEQSECGNLILLS